MGISLAEIYEREGKYVIAVCEKAQNGLSLPSFIMLYKVALTFESVDEILMCEHSNKRYRAELFCSTDYNAVQYSSDFWVYGWNA